MEWMYAAGSRFFGSLAVALLALAALAVPDRFALADSGGSCSSTCSQFTGQQYQFCMEMCGSCEGSCAQQYRQGTSGYNNCVQQNCYKINELSSCPNPKTNPCPFNNGNPNGCPNIGCTLPNGICWCVFDSGNNTCNCPD